MPIVDASALIEFLLGTPRAAQVATALAGGEVAAPELIDVEVLSTLARLARARSISDEDATLAAGAFARASVKRISHPALVPRVWQLRHRVRIADAFYVACAQRLAMPLVTADARLARTPIPGMSLLLVR
jgi:predicted nucleic acid-binding protein